MLQPSRLALAAFAAAALCSTARAQDASALVAPTVSAPVASVSSIAGPRLDGLRSGAAVAPAVALAEVHGAPAPMRKAPSQRARTLMIVGGAALLGGAIIGDDAGTIIMLGGLGVGLYGLWLYLQ